MSGGSAGWRGECDPRLVEEAVLRAIESRPAEERRAFRAGRDPLYEIQDPDDREARFLDLHARWFVRLGLSERLAAALEETPAVRRGTERCLVIPAAGEKDEGADLHESRARAGREEGAPRPVLVLLLTTRTLLDEPRLRAVLRRELLHVADMLDPEFGYERRISPADTDPGKETLLRERYRVLWGASVDGRLAAAGLLDPAAGAERRREFLATFSPLRPDAEALLQRLFDGPRPAHRDLLALAAEPAGGPPSGPIVLP